VRVVKIALSLVVLLGLGFCVLVNFVNAPDKAAADDANRQAADRIAAALHAYQAKNGVYPPELAALVPEFLSEKPQQSSGAAFSYQASPDGKEFRLAYPEAPIGALPSDAEYELKASTGKWDYVVY